MKTILFLHREELADLYILVAKNLAGKINLVHVAYSDKEATKLNEAGITSFYNYSQILKNRLTSQTADQAVLEDLDRLFIENTDGRFNLNSSLQSDRGYSLLTYDQTLLLAQAHYGVWKEIFTNHTVDIMLHEPCSLFFNHLAAIMCKAQGGIYLWQAQTKGETSDDCYLMHCFDDYTNIEIEDNLKFYLQNPDKIDVARCEKYLNAFRADYSVFMADSMTSSMSTKKLRLDTLKEYVKHKIRPNRADILNNNIDYWLHTTKFSKEKLQNALDYKKYHLTFEELPKGEKYYYYSFHLEPEAVVLYLGDGIYNNQVKLIENIAASLPAGHYLYVKDHPHEFAYRKADDYKRLINIPNIRLLRQSIPGKLVVKDAIGVFSVNGTAGFEALMLGKQVYNFGKSYYTYCDRVKFIKNIRDLREVLYSQRSVKYQDDINLMAYVNAFLDSMHKGYINYFMSLADKYCTNPTENAQQIADDLLKFSERFCKN